MSKQYIPVTLIYGDGIGPEVVGATREIIDATGALIDWQVHVAGAQVFKQGLASGIPEETIQSIKATKVVLKGPLETPVGFGEKSANVTMRKLFETYANVRPVRTLPEIITPFSDRDIDMVIVRENVEDLYAGIEYMQTATTAMALKLMTQKGCEKIIRFAFELARSEGRKKVHCATKANILKFTEGLMKTTFEKLATEYTDIEAVHIIIDNCAHQMVKTPENFEVIVTSNMNGDIISDLASGLVGGLGIAPGANIGQDVAIFEAVHGSAPKYAGKNVANPTAVLLAGVMLLRHLGLFEKAAEIENSLMYTFGQKRVFTRDLAADKVGVSTQTFTKTVIDNLGQSLAGFAPRDYHKISIPQSTPLPVAGDRLVTGLDVYIESQDHPETLGQTLNNLIADSAFELKMISSRGLTVFPVPSSLPDLGDFYQCRFMLLAQQTVHKDISETIVADLLQKISQRYHWMHIEKLSHFAGEVGYSKAQGEL